jgi:molecular chaperone GrpE
MSRKDERKEPIVNEEYEEQDTACCKADEESDACCKEAESGGCCQDDGKEDTGSCGEGSCCSANEESSRLAELEQELKEANRQRDEYLAMAQRLQADFENFKRRNKNSTADAYSSATADTVEAFLPVLDNLERALESVSGTDSGESFRKGIELVQRQFLDTLGKLGVEEIEALGKPFDPELHHAVGQVDAEDGQEENTVAAVLLKGYKTKSKVIRYSMVHVYR